MATRPRLRSHTGCWMCRGRRIKCDEHRPCCSQCSRLGSDCKFPDQTTHSNYRPRQLVLGTYKIRTPSYESQILPLFPCTWAQDLETLVRVPQTLITFFVPTASKECGDVSDLMKLTAAEDSIRDSIIACFSTIVARRTFNRAALGRVLTSLQHSLARLSELDENAIMCLQVVLTFLALTDSIGPTPSHDPLTHWLAHAHLASRLPVSYSQRACAIPPKVQLLVHEGLMFNLATLLIHAPNYERVLLAWQRSQVYEKVLRLNPPGACQVLNSPILAGQYTLHSLAMRLMGYLRKRMAPPVGHELASIEESLTDARSTLRTQFRVQDDDVHSDRATLAALYDLFCIAQLIMLEVLKDCVGPNRSTLQSLVSQGLRRFLEWLPSDGNLRLILPLYVLACAIETSGDLVLFEDKLGLIRASMDDDLSRRIHLLVRIVKSYRSAAEKRGESPSHALHLLERDDGVLGSRLDI